MDNKVDNLDNIFLLIEMFMHISVGDEKKSSGLFMY